MEEHKDLISWLRNKTDSPCIVSIGTDTEIFVRVPFEEDFDFIYHQRNYYGVPKDRHIPFEYCGFFNRIDGLLYDTESPLNGYKLSIDSGASILDLSHELEIKVRRKIERTIVEEEKQLRKVGFSNDRYYRKLEDFKSHDSDYLVKKMFLCNRSSKDITYECGYTVKSNDTNLVLNYLKHPDETINTVSTEYWQSKQDDILFELYKTGILYSKLRELENDAGNPIHKQRAIIIALFESGAKTVNVTVSKDDKEFTFKYNADRLRRYANSDYGVWEMSPKDREGYEERFGRYSSFHPEDITSISYRGKNIYEADMLELPDEDFSDDESEDSDEGYEMSM